MKNYYIYVSYNVIYLVMHGNILNILLQYYLEKKFLGGDKNIEPPKSALPRYARRRKSWCLFLILY